MVTKCVVPDCGNSCNTKLSVTLFSFPKDPQLAQQWLVATRARGVKQIKSHHKVCSKHFEKHLILDNFGATRLEPGSVPTIFEWNRKPSVKTEVSPLVSRTNPFLTVESVIELPLNSYRRVILPKPAPGQANPKVKIPPIAKRVAGLSPDSKQRLDCNVIHPESITGGQKWSQSRMSPGRERACLQVSDDDSNGPVHVGHHIEEYDSSDCPLIEVDPLQGEIEDPLESESSVLLTHSESMAGEVIIEECSIIEDEIMQPHQIQGPITAMVEKPSSNTDHDNNDVPVNEEESLPIETAELYQDEVPLSRNPILPKKTLPTSRKSSDESTCNRSLNNLPKNVVLLQFDARTGSCTENPDLNDLSAQDIASIKKSLDSSQSSRVVILKKGGVGKTAERISSSAEPPVKRASKEQPILPKGGCSNLQQNSTASSNQPPSVAALPKNNVLTKLNASGSQAYFIPQGSNITSSLASTLLLQNSSGHKHTNQVIPTTSSVPAQTNVANFLIATPTTSTLVSSQSTPSRAAPVVYQLGNVVPVGSALPRKPPEKPPQNNNVNIVAPQMTYLIPIGGSIPRPVVPKIASCSDGDNPVLPSSKESVTEAEQRLLKQVELLKSALRRKSSTILELRKDKNRLTRKLKLLGAAMGKFRKASMLNLSTSRCLKGVDNQEVANMTLDLKDFGSRRNLRDVVNTILHLSRILNEQVKSHIPETPNGRLDTLSGSGEVNVEMEPPS